MNDSYRQRRTERSDQLLQSLNDCNLPWLAFQDEKHFTNQVKLIAKIIAFIVRAGSVMLNHEDYSVNETSVP